MTDNTVRTALPLHPVPVPAFPGCLRIDGLVTNQLDLTAEDLATLIQQDVRGSFTCLEGWTVPDVRWQGVPLANVLDRAQPSAAAQWVEASAGRFSISLPMDVAQRSILALHLDGEPLPIAHGGPVRLVVPGGECYTSVKWLDHLEVRMEPGSNAGQTIALGRLTDAPAHRQE